MNDILSKKKKQTIQRFLNEVNEQKCSLFNQNKKVFKEDNNRTNTLDARNLNQKKSAHSQTSSTQSDERP